MANTPPSANNKKWPGGYRVFVAEPDRDDLNRSLPVRRFSPMGLSVRMTDDHLRWIGELPALFVQAGGWSSLAGPTIGRAASKGNEQDS